MRLATFNGGRIGTVSDELVADRTDELEAALGPFGGKSAMRTVIENWEIAEPILSSAPTVTIDRSDVTWDPSVPDATKIVAAPINYRDHQSEMRVEHHVDGLGVFLKAPSSLLAADGVIELPYSDRRFDHEAEVALVIGRRARHVSPDDALSYVFGYIPLMDITMRGGEDRSTRKSFNTFTPIGPSIVTADEFGDPGAVEFSLTVNGDPRQKATTADLIWNFPRLIAYVSSVMTLEPGDIITTGTPAGVAPIEDGDEVVLAIDGLDTLRVTVRGATDAPSPTRGADHGPSAPPPPTRRTTN